MDGSCRAERQQPMGGGGQVGPEGSSTEYIYLIGKFHF